LLAPVVHPAPAFAPSAALPAPLGIAPSAAFPIPALPEAVKPNTDPAAVGVAAAALTEAQVPSPRQYVEDDADVPLFKLATGKLPVTPVARETCDQEVVPPVVLVSA